MLRIFHRSHLGGSAGTELEEGGGGCLAWVLSEPSPEKVADLVRWFADVELPEEEVRVESEGW